MNKPKQPPKAFYRRFIVQVGGFALAGLLVVFALRSAGIQFALSGSLIGDPACLPYYVYLIRLRPPNTIEKGDFVVLKMPRTAFGVGPEPGDQLVKVVAGLEGDQIRIEGTELWINDMHRDRLWLAKSIPGAAPGDFDRAQTLSASEVFLLGSLKESFDSRYWGPVQRGDIIGTAIPLL